MDLGRADMSRANIGLGVTLHWGDPELPTSMSWVTGRYGVAGTWREVSARHEIVRWYGISGNGRWALLFMRMERRPDIRVPTHAPAFGEDVAGER
jgi:hypothetical protein